jgi:TolB protein
MIRIPNPSVGRRGLIAGAAGIATAAAGLLTPIPVLAQPAPPQAAPSGGSGPSAVIDVDHARSEPIPIAIPDLGGPDGASAQLGHDISSVISADLARSGLFRLIDQAAFIQAGATTSAAPNFANWKPTGAQALVTGSVQIQGGGQVRVEFRLWDILPQTQIQGTAYTTTQATGAASPTSWPMSSTNACSARKATSTPASSTSPPPARATAAPSASPSWTRTARTTACSPTAPGSS